MADLRRPAEYSRSHSCLSVAWHDCSGVRVACCRLGDRLGCADDGRCLPAERQPRQVVARSRRIVVPRLWSASGCHTAHRGDRADMVDGRLCHRIWRRTRHPILQAPVQTAPTNRPNGRRNGRLIVTGNGIDVEGSEEIEQRLFETFPASDQPSWIVFARTAQPMRVLPNRTL